MTVGGRRCTTNSSGTRSFRRRSSKRSPSPDGYGIAEDVYIAEADPLARADVVVDNNDFDRPLLLRG